MYCFIFHSTDNLTSHLNFCCLFAISSNILSAIHKLLRMDDLKINNKKLLVLVQNQNQALCWISVWVHSTAGLLDSNNRSSRTQYLNLELIWAWRAIYSPCPPNCSTGNAVFSLQNYLQQAIVLRMKPSTIQSSNNSNIHILLWHHIL